MLDKKSNNTLTPDRVWSAVRPLLVMQLGADAPRLDHSLVLEQQDSLWRVGVASDEDAHILNNGLNGAVVACLGTAVGQPVMVEFLAVGPPPLLPEGRGNGRVLPPADGHAAPGLTPQKAWQATLAELELQMTKATFNTWLKDTALVGQQDGVWTIGVRNEQAVEWLTSRLYGTIARTLAAVAGTAVTLTFVVEGTRVGGLNGRVPEEPEAPPFEPDETAQATPAASNLPPEEIAPRVTLAKPKEKRKKKGEDDDSRESGFRHPRKDVPTESFVKVPHYTIRFWRPYLGADVFDLWLILSSHAYEFQDKDGATCRPGPSIKNLLSKMGRGDRNDLTGREASGGRPAKKGWLNELREQRICNHVVEGHGKGSRHYFDHMTLVHQAPVLTPWQVSHLDEGLQIEHYQWLSKHNIDIDAWERDRRFTQLEFPFKA